MISQIVSSESPLSGMKRSVTATGASASSGKSYTMTAAGEISGSFSAGKSYTLWLWTSSTPTGSVSYINKSTITMEGI